MRTFKFLDLFAGCGGLSEGFEAVGRYESIAHVEWEHAPAETIRRRLVQMGRMSSADTDERVIEFDIQKHEDLLSGPLRTSGCNRVSPGLLDLVNECGGVDLVVGGPPCQAYSIAGRVRDEHGMQNDYRNYLFESYLRIVEKLSPSLFVFENVPGLLSAKPFGIPIEASIRHAISQSGYVTVPHLKAALVRFDQYGVPQFRSRLIILGLKKDAFPNHSELLTRFYSEVLPRYRASTGIGQSAQEAIGDLPRLFPLRVTSTEQGRRYSHSFGSSDVDSHVPRFHSDRDVRIFEELARDRLLPEGLRRFRTINDLKQLYTQRTGKSSAVHKYHVINPDSPSNLIPAHLYKDGLRHIHWDPEQARSITVREAASLQSFPLDFKFFGSQSDAYKMIGNAVPPAFSRVLALALLEVLNEPRKKGIRTRMSHESALLVD